MCCKARHPLVVGDLGLLIVSVGAATASCHTRPTVLSHAIWYVAVADVRRVKKFACRTRARQLHIPHTDQGHKFVIWRVMVGRVVVFSATARGHSLVQKYVPGPRPLGYSTKFESTCNVLSTRADHASERIKILPTLPSTMNYKTNIRAIGKKQLAL